MKVLVIEDDKTIIDSISLIFQLSWPETKLISTPLGQKGIELAEVEKPDVVILDLGLPDISGYEVLKQIRLFSAVPIIILTVRAEEVDIVRRLEGGADDYIVKPFRQLELLFRIRSVTRRQERLVQEKPLEFGQLYFNPSTWQLFVGEREISVTRTEGSIFYHLLQNAGKVVIHSDLAEVVWGVDYPDAADCLRVHIRRLRVKIEEDPRQPAAPVALRNEQDLNMELPDSLPTVWVDEERFCQVVLNLMNNAFKFTPPGGQVTLKAKQKDANLVVEVHDSGPGIDKEDQQLLFEPYQILKGDKEHLSGLGLGLSLSKQLVELHGGQIWVESQKGKGSTFGFSLPIKPMTRGKPEEGEQR